MAGMAREIVSTGQLGTEAHSVEHNAARRAWDATRAAPRLPAGLVPRTPERVRARLRRSWRNMGKPIPTDLMSWATERLYAAWYELLRRSGWPVSDN